MKYRGVVSICVQMAQSGARDAWREILIPHLEAVLTPLRRVLIRVTVA